MRVDTVSRATLQPTVWMWIECGSIHECLAVCVFSMNFGVCL